MRELGNLATVRPQSSPSRERTVLGAARVDKRTKNLTARLKPGDVAVIDHSDLDALAARSLAEARVSAVINARPFISGKYPNRGPGVLANASIPMYELADQDAFALIREGGALTIDAQDRKSVG